ncbi:hypothetical protein JZ751_009949 [Albula glossodonta]|uniref:Uncharacterized protein n=1 Tax=Albula glossodonta TaxID=121402 RepID=A0A8T2P721_9TELE|nr:hypothetical protein JZ751_009949 [Albula glossodonta]
MADIEGDEIRSAAPSLLHTSRYRRPNSDHGDVRPSTVPSYQEGQRTELVSRRGTEY